jgi:DNA-directed RNA polymerase specialized sigma24 family protein
MLPQSEAAKRLAALTPLERAKLVALADGLSQNTGWGADDLLQEAFTRVIAGDRTLPAEVQTVPAIFQIMRSIAFGVRKSGGGKIAKASKALDSVELESGAVNEEDLDGGAFELLHQKFEGEEEIQLVLMALGDGATRDQICSDLGLDHKRYATIRRRLRRAYNEFVAGGMP